MTDSVKRMIGRRAFKKVLITQDLRALEAPDETKYSFHLLDGYINSISNNLLAIEEFDAEICEAISDSEMTDVLSSSRDYHMSICVTLAKYKAARDNLTKKSSSPDPITNPLPSITIKIPLPPIHIQTFENNSENPFSYYNFKKSFNNAIAGMPNLTGAQKLLSKRLLVRGGS